METLILISTKKANLVTHVLNADKLVIGQENVIVVTFVSLDLVNLVVIVMKIVVTMKHTLESHTTTEITEINMIEMNDILLHLLLNVVDMNVLMSVMEEASHMRLSTEESIEIMIDLMIEKETTDPMIDLIRNVTMSAITEITMRDRIILHHHHHHHSEILEMGMSVKYMIVDLYHLQMFLHILLEVELVLHHRHHHLLHVEVVMTGE